MQAKRPYTSVLYILAIDFSRLIFGFILMAGARTNSEMPQHPLNLNNSSLVGENEKKLQRNKGIA